MSKRALLVTVLVVGALGLLAFSCVAALGPLLSEGGGRARFDAPGVLVIDLDGQVVERAPADFFSRELLGAHTELLDLALALDAAAEDDRIAGVYLRMGMPGYGWAKAEEIRARLARFRESGKFVYAWTSFTNELGYYTALGADRIYVLPGSGMEMNGFRVEAPYARRLMEKLGIDPQIEATGAYKSAVDVFQRDDMSEADREALGAILGLVHSRFVDAAVAARRVDRARLVAALDQGVYVARDLQALGLIDGERHEGAVLREAVARARGEDAAEIEPGDPASHAIDVRDYAANLPGRGSTDGTIALVYATGAIMGGESGYDPIFGPTMGSRTMVRMLDDVARDEDVDAVVLRIDSPGGDAFASEEIWAAVGDLAARVPVIVSMGDVAASGGYYIAAAADTIVAEPTTITGSIGVFAILFDLSGTWDKVGVSWDVEKTGEAADFPSTNRPLRPEERETFSRLVDHAYRSFLGRVSQGRGMEVPAVHAVAQGRVWTGDAARERGLVDLVGGLDVAMRAAKGAAGIDPDARVALHVYPAEPRLIDQLRAMLRMRGMRAAPAAASPFGGSPLALNAAREIAAAMPGAGVVLRHGPGRPLAVLPRALEAR